ncbi:MAG: glycosyltransferase [Microgenomates group bacterium]
MHSKKVKIAIVYDWIDKWGGVERVLLHLNRLLPHADFYTSAVDMSRAQWAKKLSTHSSFIQSFPLFLRRKRSLLLPIYPIAFESFNFSEYDVVISITSAFAKGIITKPGTRHICYLLTPPRYLWSHIEDYLSPIERMIYAPILSHVREWDKKAAQRPDTFVSISQTVADRALSVYGVKSDIVFPPFDTFYWDKQKSIATKEPKLVPTHPYFLWVGRMEKYKKPDLICEAARLMPNSSFVFVGTGALESYLRRIAPSNCHFLGFVSDSQLSKLYSHADALIMPQNEDFGYISLEAQYHGCPVIAYGAGGALETVRPEISGLFFEEQNGSSLVAVLERFNQISYNLRHSTEGRFKEIQNQFGLERFDTQLIHYLE